MMINDKDLKNAVLINDSIKRETKPQFSQLDMLVAISLINLILAVLNLAARH